MKTIYWQSNYNNKLACDCFLHIDLAPKETIPESKFEKIEVEIRTSDNSHPPTAAKLKDILRLPLKDISAVFTWPSHGLDRLSFINFILQQNRKINNETPMAIYYYEKLTNKTP